MSDVTQNVCNLECVKDGKVHEFIGPVKIILMDPPEEKYNRKKMGAAFIGLANMLMGATTVTVLFFILSFSLELYNNVHVFLCTVGYQLFMPSAILMVNKLNGPSSALKIFDRKIQHLFLQIFGMIFGFGGSALMVLYGQSSEAKDTNSNHFIAGLGVALFSILSSLLGPGAFFYNPEGSFSSLITSIHRFFGVLAIMSSAVCFILGIMKPVFKAWLPLADMLYFLIAFCVFYSVVVIVSPMKKIIIKKSKTVEEEK